MTKCDDCRLVKSPIIYLRSSRKLCRKCFDAERLTVKDLIKAMPFVLPWEPLLGYNFVLNEWFNNEREGKRYADFIFDNVKAVSN